MKTFGFRTDVRKLIKRFIANTATTIAAANKQPVATQRRLFFALREKKNTEHTVLKLGVFVPLEGFQSNP